MATQLDRQPVPVIVESAPAGDWIVAPEEDLDWDEAEPSFPWARLLLIGALLGIGVGLPLVPSSDTVLAFVGNVAGALGCPYHPTPSDLG